MKFSLFLLFFWSLQTLAVGTVGPSFLIQFKHQKVFSSKEFLALKNRYALKQKSFFKVLGMAFYESARPLDNSLIEAICAEALRQPGIIRCTRNEQLTDLQDPLCAPTNKDQSFIDFLSCELVPKRGSPHKQKGLSTYWAQEFTGADLLRDRLNAMKLRSPPDLVGIIDSLGDHGDMVGQLIEGPTLASTIPAYIKTDNMGTYDFESLIKNIEDCLAQKKCPDYINHSQTWGSGDTVAVMVSKLAKQGKVFITAAGNDGIAMERWHLSKVKMAEANQVIIVGSLSPQGEASIFSNFSSAIDISAPSDYFITSAGKYDDPGNFGGTSAAAPQVTAALAAFTLISGYKLTIPEAKKLLKETALPIPGLPRISNLGPGSLNTYKIGELALKLKNKCSNDKACIIHTLASSDFYSIVSENSVLMKEALTTFPTCHGNIQTVFNDCETSKSVFKRLRQAALIDPEDKGLWDILACISRTNGLQLNAQYYDNMARRIGKSDDVLIKDMLHSGKGIDLIKYAFTAPYSQEDKKMIKALVDSGKYDEEIVDHILTIPDLHETEKWLSKIMERGKADLQVLKSIAVTSNRPDLVETILDRGSADSYIAKEILRTSFYLERSDWAEKLLQKNKVEIDRGLSYSLLENSTVMNSGPWLRTILDRRRDDPVVVETIFRQRMSVEYAPELENIILTSISSNRAPAGDVKVFDELINFNILTQSHWTEYYEKEIGKTVVTCDDIRKYLANSASTKSID